MTAMTEVVAELLVDVQNALSDEADEPPSAAALSNWAQLAYASVEDSPSEVTIRLVDESEMTELNQNYRNKLGTTNVLSFPVDAEIDIPLLGDIVICHQVILKEAQEQQKTQQDHYAHMVTHGVLHLCGYDHYQDAEAEEMEALEVQILAQSNIANPYS